METDGRYTCGEHSIMRNFVKSVRCMPETKSVNYNQKNYRQAIQTGGILNTK